MIMLFTLSLITVTAGTRRALVVEQATRTPLAGVSIFDSKGNPAGVSDAKGHLPNLTEGAYPITVRCLGYKEQILNEARDTVFMEENFTDLPEIVIESRQHKVLHILAYVREYSTLTNYRDTVSLFREKMVDFMLPEEKVKFNGWRSPRRLKSNSYYRFTNDSGLDSVSSESHFHFSWSDWIGISPSLVLPAKLRGSETATDTLYGKYSPTEIWTRNNDRVTVNINVLADTLSRKWVPNVSGFFRNDLDFESFRVKMNYDNVIYDSIGVTNLTGYSFNVESNGRAFEMFRFNKSTEPIYVSTYAEVYILDKEFITVKEARKWERREYDAEKMEIYEPENAPELPQSVAELIERVGNIDKEQVRLGQAPDQRLGSRKVVKHHFGKRVLQLLKTATGISNLIAKRRWNNNWKNFKKSYKEQSKKK